MCVKTVWHTVRVPRTRAANRSSFSKVAHVCTPCPFFSLCLLTIPCCTLGQAVIDGGAYSPVDGPPM